MLLRCPSVELNLPLVLLNGQSFRWMEKDGWFVGTALGRLWRIRRKDEKNIEWTVIGRRKGTEDDANALKEYLQLDVSLSSLYEGWSTADPFIRSLLLSDALKGIRVLRQDPLETIFAFICSANNNISRITKMVNRLAVLWGERLVPVDTPSFSSIEKEFPFLAYDFPLLDGFVTDGMEEILRKEGFGYRAAYIRNTVSLLREKTDVFLKIIGDSCEYEKAKTFLQELSGIGPKVADCICLMSLGHSHVVPMDVHMWRLSRERYIHSLPTSPNQARFEEVRQFYEKTFGEYAGWTQAILFNSQLKRKTENNEKRVKKKNL